MKKYAWIVLILLTSTETYASKAQHYMQRFNTYQYWCQHLPAKPTPEFLAFIESNTPLAKRLRDKWLYQLAHMLDWKTYTQYYQFTDDINLQCYEYSALYQQGNQQTAVNAAIPLWLNGQSLPPACNTLVNLLLKNHEIGDGLIKQRLILAMQQGNLSLSRYLLEQFTRPHLQDVKILTDVYFNPTHVMMLHPGELQGSIALFGLKRLIFINSKKAIQLWDWLQDKHILKDSEKQDFLVNMTTYKLIHDEPDSNLWFSKISPRFYTDKLLDVKIRAELKLQHWHTVLHLIPYRTDRTDPIWIYWTARAREVLGQKEQAALLYQTIAQTRNYYGFLASLRLHRHFSFEDESTDTNIHQLYPYYPVTMQLKALYQANQVQQASRLLSDFILELPKEHKSALLYWLGQELQWHGKSIYLSSNEEFNNQLTLRFPLAYENTIRRSAVNYHIPRSFIYAIIRQESTFREDAVSSAGAHGLMQILPNTAQDIAKSEKFTLSDNRQLFIPQNNIHIGTAYIQRLAKRFDSHPVLIAAAYNAGPGQVMRWLKTHPPKDIDVWIETLPWFETRNYVKNILSFYAVYQYRLRQKPDLSEFMRPF